MHERQRSPKLGLVATYIHTYIHNQHVCIEKERSLPRRPFHRVQDEEAKDVDEVGVGDGGVKAMEVVHAADGGGATRAVDVVEEELAHQEVGVVVPLPGVGVELGRGAQDGGDGRDAEGAEERKVDGGHGEEREVDIESVRDDGVPVPSLVQRLHHLVPEATESAASPRPPCHATSHKGYQQAPNKGSKG